MEGGSIRRLANREEYEDVMARFRIKEDEEETQEEEEEEQQKDDESDTEGGI